MPVRFDGTMGSVLLFQALRDALGVASPNAIHTPLALHAPVGGVPISLRTMDMDDADEWNAVRWQNSEWLKPWAAGDPMHGPGMTFAQWVRQQRRNEAQGTGVVFMIEYRKRMIGQISIGAITYGAMRSGVVGYWVAREYAGHGIASTALAMLADWAIGSPDGPQLHRLEIAILPENERSLGVVRKLGARDEGEKANYMYVDGRWRTHRVFSLLAEDVEDGFESRLISRHAHEETRIL